MAERIRVLIADDHPVVREGLTFLLGAQEDIEVVAAAADGEECVREARALRPDVLVVDLRMPNKNGLAAIREILSEQPDARVIVLTGFEDEQEVHAALCAGAVGFLLKGASTHQLLDAIRSVYHGASVLEPALAEKMLGANGQGRLVEPLSPRERDVLGLIAQGRQNKEIARQLGIAEQTVLTHVRSIFRKLRLGNRTEAALYAREHGLG
jgi:DNA-binding NarL/FixJ family response regulator